MTPYYITMIKVEPASDYSKKKRELSLKKWFDTKQLCKII